MLESKTDGEKEKKSCVCVCCFVLSSVAAAVAVVEEDFKTVSQPFEVCLFLFRRKIGNFWFSFWPLGVFVKLRS